MALKEAVVRTSIPKKNDHHDKLLEATGNPLEIEAAYQAICDISLSAMELVIDGRRKCYLNFDLSLSCYRLVDFVNADVAGAIISRCFHVASRGVSY